MNTLGPEGKKPPLKNIVSINLLNGVFSHALEEYPDFIAARASDQSEVVGFTNSRVKVELTRPTLNGGQSEVWEAPWDGSLKMQMHLKVDSVDGNKFRFTDREGMTYYLDEVEVGILEDERIIPFFRNGGEVIVGQEVGDDYLTDLLEGGCQFVPPNR